LASCATFFYDIHAQRLVEAGLKVRPIAIGPEWFIVRHHFVTGR
jgi:hypothetical protein